MTQLICPLPTDSFRHSGHELGTSSSDTSARTMASPEILSASAT
jgi:hypothetical protein